FMYAQFSHVILLSNNLPKALFNPDWLSSVKRGLLVFSTFFALTGSLCFALIPLQMHGFCAKL
ncbi:hypothetical protein, partial [Aquidulcibacter paucihalophilus]|uniref:hypothetical protein n=1 Tax=Aquidulcibacter paucihalophilus TaxID=1978549 RepID=UPI001E5D0A61